MVVKHSEEECEVKCDALKEVLTQIQQNAGIDVDIIRHLAESGLDLIRDLKSEFKD
jgi:hypothetical protein